MKPIIAAFLFFTRLPLWKFISIPKEYFREVINYWAVTGWLTGGVMALTTWLASLIFPLSIAILLGLSARIWLTGAFHEDGLADFFDGFGGGTSKEKTLAIMKDSHIGTYGVLGLILYFALLFFALSNIHTPFLFGVILAADSFCKFLSAQVTHFLPYARTETTSKSQVVYQSTTLRAFLISLFFGLLPLLLLGEPRFLFVLLFPIILFSGLVYFMKQKIGGYTGDCCGALFLLCELSFYLGIVVFLL